MMKFRPYILICLLLASGAGPAADSINLPDIGDSSGSVISPELERRLGKAFLRNVRQHTEIISDPEVESYIESIGYQLVANSDTNSLPFTFFIVKRPEINAFAAPGGVIGINSGTILNSQNESELAAVLAHEIAHVTQRHMARSFEKAEQSSLPAAAALLGSILLSIANPQAGAAALTVATGARLQNRISFTRENEQEADSVGMQLLVRSGYDPRGMPAFFERLQKKSETSQNSAPEFLRTHPLTLSRIADSKDRSSTYPQVYVPNTATYDLVRAKIEVNSYVNSAMAVSIFKHRLSANSIQRQVAVRYGYALALTKTRDYQQAREQLNILLDWDRDNRAYMIATANLESEQRNYDAALTILRQAYRLYPDDRPLVMAYAKALLDGAQPVMARDLLRHYSRQRDLSPLYYGLLAQADAQSGEAVDSAIAKAEYFYLIGDTKSAMERLNQIKQDSDPNPYQKETITAKISQLEYELELEEELQI